MTLEGEHLLLEFLGRFEIQGFGGLGHPGLVMLDDFSPASAEDMDNFLYVGTVFLLRDLAHAGSLAAAYMEIQAWAEAVPQYGLGINLEGAAADRIGLAEELHQIARVEGGGIWSEIAVPLLPLDAAGNENPRELIPGNADPGIGFGILQENVRG